MNGINEWLEVERCEATRINLPRGSIMFKLAQKELSLTHT